MKTDLEHILQAQVENLNQLVQNLEVQIAVYKSLNETNEQIKQSQEKQIADLKFINSL